MASMTPYGRKAFQNAILSVPHKVHLYVESGELTGFGYSPKRLVAAEFDDNGLYPEQIWVFNSEAEAAMVLGLYVTDADGQVLYSDQFPEPYKIQNQGDRIGVSVNMSFLGALGSE